MEIITGEKEDLFDMLSDALEQAKVVSRNADKVALYNYIGNLYGAINVNGRQGFSVSYKECFQNRRNYLKFLKSAHIYENIFAKNFFENKDFHSKYLGDVFDCYSDNMRKLADISASEESTYFGKEEFFNVLFGFLSKYGLEKFFREFMDKRRVFEKLKKHNDDYMGLTILNPLNGDAACLITKPDYDLDTMVTLIHEFGHVYDLSKIDGDIPYKLNSYSYLSCYPEVFPKLLEKLFFQYLIDNNIMVSEVKDKYIDTILVNHDFLLSSYMFSLIDDKYFKKNGGLVISDAAFLKEMKKHFVNLELIRELIHSGKLDMFGDTVYTYGEIMSFHLLEPVLEEGFKSPDLRRFMRCKTLSFNPNYLVDNGYIPDNYAKVFRKSVDLCRK